MLWCYCHYGLFCRLWHQRGLVCGAFPWRHVGETQGECGEVQKGWLQIRAGTGRSRCRTKNRHVHRQGELRARWKLPKRRQGCRSKKQDAARLKNMA